MEKYRYGFRLWWKGCSKYLNRIGMGKPGSYDKRNQHAGEMFALPSDFSLTKKQAARVLYECLKSKKFTFSQMRSVKKTLSYAYQLQGGEPGKNFTTIPGVWILVESQKDLQPQHHFCIPTKIPLPKELKSAFSKEYDASCGWSFADWNRGLLCAWDWGVNGARSKEDLDRIKKGRMHGIDHQEGWGWTEFYGGRSKLCFAKKGSRPWRAWRICLCEGKHTPIPKDGETDFIGRDGNLLKEPTWCTNCPVNAMDLMFRQQEALKPLGSANDNAYRHCRVYRKWCESKGKCGLTSEGQPVELALRWLKAQGVERDFDTNAGRKALSRWLTKLEIPYAMGMQIHGDLEDVWEKSYQPGLKKNGYTIREQSLTPDVACYALRKLANWLGRGVKVKPLLLNRRDKMLFALMEAHGQGEKAKQILHGFPTDSDEED